MSWKSVGTSGCGRSTCAGQGVSDAVDFDCRCAGAFRARARPIGRGILPRQDRHHPDRLHRRRRLRPLRARARPPSRPAHSRQSDGGGAEHAGRRLAEGHQYVYSVAPKDGTVLAHRQPRHGDRSAARATPSSTPTKFTWIGSITSEISICATWNTSPVKTWDDMFKREFTLGGSAAGADPDTFALILRNVFGAKVKLVTGYPGGNDINLAMERGEVDGRCGWSWSSLKSQKTLAAQEDQPAGAVRAWRRMPISRTCRSRSSARRTRSSARCCA